jgi:glycosyltransferase involved in cell wall biosynthesis
LNELYSERNIVKPGKNEVKWLNMTPQIGIDYTAALHQSAGIGRYTREMVKALAAQPNGRRYRLFVAGARAVTLPELPGPNFGWALTGWSERWLARLWYRLRLPLPIERWTGPLDLFHAPDFFLPPVRRGTRAVVTVHDLSFIHYPDMVMPGMTRQLNTWVPRSVERADHVIAVSEATRLDLIEFYHTPPEKISVFYHGVTPEFQPITKPSQLAAVRQKYGLGESQFILSVGTLHPRKNYRRLIQAVARLKHPIHLVIVGSKGWQYEEVFSEVDRQNLTERAHFIGFVADGDLPALYSAASLLVNPSLYEGFGLPTLEALACGTPVIASNQSALPEVVGQAGLLVDPLEVDEIAAAITRLLDDADLHQQLAAAGLRQATRFTWDDMAAKLSALYDQMLAK